MAVWSSFASRSIEKLEKARRLIFSFRNGPTNKGINIVPVRKSHDRTLPIRTSTFDNYKLKDLIYLYVAVGVIPFGAIILYCNIFIGPATLALIPEDYNPKPWEYHRHPITRFFAKYLTPSKQEVYERNLHNIFKKQEKHELKKLERYINDLIKERRDYQAWYFEKPQAKYGRHLNEAYRQAEGEEKGFKAGWIR